MATPLQMASTIFLLAAKFMCAPGAIKAEQNTSLTDSISHNWNPKNIRESSLDFTARFGEITPRHTLSLQTRPVGARKVCFRLFSLCPERDDEKNC